MSIALALVAAALTVALALLVRAFVLRELRELDARLHAIRPPWERECYTKQNAAAFRCFDCLYTPHVVGPDGAVWFKSTNGERWVLSLLPWSADDFAKHDCTELTGTPKGERAIMGFLDAAGIFRSDRMERGGGGNE
jgi:hypothetical protein